MKKILRYLIPVVVCLVVGWVGSLMHSADSEQWLLSLNRSALTPSASVFPIIWTLLYLLMGLSMGSMLARGEKSLLPLWSLQLLFNFLWSVCFFALRAPFAALVDIMILDVLILLYLLEAASVRRLAAWLWSPYVIWVLMATYFNAYIFLYN